MRTRRPRHPFAAPLLIAVLSIVPGVQSPAQTVESEALEQLAVTVIAGEPRPVVDLAAREAVLDAGHNLETHDALLHEAQRLALLAFAERGYAQDGTGSLDEADRLLEEAERTVRASIQERETSEAYRVLADCLNQLLDIRGTGYRMLHAASARRAAERAVSLDANNPLARISAAAYYGSAARIVGGDPDKALLELNAAGRLSDGSDYLEFLIALWRGRVRLRFGETVAARRYLAQAAAIYPRNWLLLSVLNEHDIVMPADGQ